MHSDRTDYDSPWKEALERYFPDFMAFFFPLAHADIAWASGYEFLDKELQQVAADAELGRRMVDKLVKVWLKEGEEAWVLAHIEIQGQEEAEFAKRMYVYNYRLYDKYRQQVVSLAVLGDEQEGWRPEEFGYERWGCRVILRFPVVKLLDYRQHWSVLAENRNPFATVVMAHLKAQETRQDASERKVWKFRLTRRLYEQGYGKQDVLNLFRLIDWLLWLPEELEEIFRQEMEAYEEAKAMPYITSVERIGIKKGIRQGIEQGELRNARKAVLRVLKTRFREVPTSIEAGIQSIEDMETLDRLLEQAVKTESLEEFGKALLA
ncbi:MAG: cytosolic protein [Armatimonadetes bacterium]|nr:cytosolic protein [Armatimonadota bacterium]